MKPEQLRKFALFNTLNDEHCSTVSELFVEERFEEGTRIFSEGDSGDRLYLIGRGEDEADSRFPLTTRRGILRQGGSLGE